MLVKPRGDQPQFSKMIKSKGDQPYLSLIVEFVWLTYKI
jgi:hypothetical protein